MTQIVEDRVRGEGVDLVVRRCGEGPLALCLHGFPDSAHTWDGLLPRLADAGYTAVAPYLRGYAPSGLAPDGCYSVPASALDAVALHDALGGGEPGVIIGHDWGAAITYTAVAYQPERWRRAVTLAVPPGQAFMTAFLTSYDQQQRSWYMFLFQHPLAELMVGAGDLTFIDRLWSDWSPGLESSTWAAHAKDCLRPDGHLAAALGYYRATLGEGYKDPTHSALEASMGAPLAVPTLYLHGADDGCVGTEFLDLSREALAAPGSELVVVGGAGHFLHLEQPEVFDRILAFVGPGR